MERQQLKFIEELVISHSKRMAEAAYRHTGSRETAEDLVQEVFILACAKIDTVFAHEKPVGWLYTTLNNLTRREMDRAYHTEQSISPTEEAANTREIDLSLETLLPEGLTEDEREILLLRVGRGCSFAEISELLGISAPACRKRYERARAECRRLIEQGER